jgi:signal transduction histidine kinase
MIALGVASLAAAMSARAGERGTPSEAKAMLEKAVAHYTAVGRKQALADFNAKKTPFFDRDLYVFCIGSDGSLVANGGYPSWVGQPVDLLKDANGNVLGKSLIAAAAPAASGSVEYPHINPVSRKPELKVSFVQRVGEDVCGVGAYKGD